MNVAAGPLNALRSAAPDPLPLAGEVGGGGVDARNERAGMAMTSVIRHSLRSLRALDTPFRRAVIGIILTFLSE
jgi:hypothetical protein